MNLNWYSFEESYLLSIDYRITECKLTLYIDARMSIDHPRCHQVNLFEQKFVELEMIFDGVQYYRSVNSSNLKTDPNDDFGSIHSIAIKELGVAERKVLGVVSDSEPAKLVLDFQDGTTAEVYSKSTEMKFLDFVSEMLAFRVGFKSIQVCERS
ncbi:hypothetical protein [Sporomusa sp.]|uniref:hypothetical protein n=1 Tax=Sporomusa sp. TaxID=2078658 RepID=UPI002D0C5CF3|nr:hypothetical protein [Sporomusa sp.]HWR09901.1 hypothetical protein [Sporomusa sp.]